MASPVPVYPRARRRDRPSRREFGRVGGRLELAEVDLVHDPVAVHAIQGELKALVAAARTTRRSRRRSSSATSCSPRRSTRSTAAAPTSAAASASRACRAPTSKGAGEWFNHTPMRVTGPNAQGCFECHEQPFEDGAGAPSANVHRDSVPHRHRGAVRRAQHAARLRAGRDPAPRRGDDRRASPRPGAAAQVCRVGGTAAAPLSTKGVNFGRCARRGPRRHRARSGSTPTASAASTSCRRSTTRRAGPTLIVRPFQWKGSVAVPARLQPRRVSQRARHAGGRDRRRRRRRRLRRRRQRDDDRRSDGAAIYLAAQPRPTTLLELNDARPARAGAHPRSRSRDQPRRRRSSSEVGCAIVPHPAP